MLLAACFVQLREATTQYGVDAYIRRAEISEERAGRLEDKNDALAGEAERLRSRLETAEDALSRQERDLRDALRVREEGNELCQRLRRDLERTSEELQRCESRPHTVTHTFSLAVDPYMCDCCSWAGVAAHNATATHAIRA